MAIIYTYPVKANPVDDDLVLISDSADKNNTKQVKISSMRGATVSGVADVNIGTSSASTGAPLVSLPNSGNVIITSKAYNGSTNVGHVPAGGSATTFLRGDGSWVIPTDTVYGVMSSNNNYAAGLVLAGAADHENNFLRKDGAWAIPVNTTYTGSSGITLTGTNFTNADRGSSQFIFKNIAVSGQDTVVADSNNDTLTLAAGNNITLTTSNTTDTVTIESSGGSAGGQTPVDYAVSTDFEATGGNVQYFYMFTCHGNFTLNRMYWYQNVSSSQVVTWAIYSGNLSNATLLGQGSATATQTRVNYVDITAEGGQNLNLVKGNTYLIGHQQGNQNGSIACLTSAVSNSGLAVTNAGSGGFPATFPDSEITYTATGVRPCVSLVP